MPFRVQLRRSKGWRLPGGTVVVSRPSRWGNPFRVGDVLPDGVRVVDNGQAVRLFADHLAAHPELVARARLQLGGKNLACWCPSGVPCHADVLLRVANGERVARVEIGKRLNGVALATTGKVIA